MPKSPDTFLKELWPEFETDQYVSLEYSLPESEQQIIADVLTARNARCVICGRADFMNFEISFAFLRQKPIAIHAYCPCGMRVGTISKASIFSQKTIKPALPITLEEFFKQIELNNSDKGELK